MNLGGKLKYLTEHQGFRASPVAVLARLLLWRIHCALGVWGRVELPAWELEIHLPPQWRGVAKLVFAFREAYEQELSYLREVLAGGCVFVDVGACFGIYTLLAARLVGGAGHVLSFEPASEAFSVLRRNIETNRLSNVTGRRIALSERAGNVNLYRYADSSRNSLGSSNLSVGSESVTASTLDRELAVSRQGRVDAIKIDAEGAEELVLRGAKETLSRSRPKIIFEFNPDAAQELGLRPEGAWTLLRKYGYRFWHWDCGSDLRSLRSPPSFGNVIATHERG